MTEPDSSKNPAPAPEDLKKSMESMPEGPNVEFSPWEVQAAKGETPLEGPRAGQDADDPAPVDSTSEEKGQGTAPRR